MTTVAVWTSLKQLADVWSRSARIQTLTGQLPLLNNAKTGVPEALRNLDAGMDNVSRNPLETAMWEPLAEMLPMVSLDPEVRSFLRSVAPIGQSLESTLGWIRARLPLYPLIPAPQMAANGYRRCEEYSRRRLCWRKSVLQAGLQFMGSPPMVADRLGLPEQDVAFATSSLVTALQATPEWAAYSELCGSLTEHDRATLAAARREVNERLTAEKVDEFEPDRMARRERFRIDQVEGVVQTLSGKPREFADAFEKVDEVIDLVANDVFGQLVTIGPAIEVAAIADLEWEGTTVKFRNVSDTAVAPGNLVTIPDPLVTDVLHIEDVMCASDADSGMVVRYSGRLLAESATVLTRAD